MLNFTSSFRSMPPSSSYRITSDGRGGGALRRFDQESAPFGIWLVNQLT
jgi:hypothetical protein